MPAATVDSRRIALPRLRPVRAFGERAESFSGLRECRRDVRECEGLLCDRVVGGREAGDGVLALGDAHHADVVVSMA